MSLSRRQFLRAGTVAAAATVAGAWEPKSAQGPMPKRAFGRTGWKASIYALGSAEIPDTPKAARGFKPMTRAEKTALESKSKEWADEGVLWWKRR